MDKLELIKELTKDVLLPILVATVTYIFFGKFDEWKKRRSQSKLGSVIIDSLIEEVQNGLNTMNQFNAGTLVNQRLLPFKSWSGMSTVPDDVLLRIIETSNGIKTKSFPPMQIRIHLKNYFDHMCISWNHAMVGANWIGDCKQLIKNAKYDEAAENVLIMLQQCKDLLNDNSERKFPK